MGKFYTIGATVNSLEKCISLLDKKVDYIGLSTVLVQEKYIKTLEELKNQTPLIVIGDITLDNISTVIKRGVHGVAVSDVITKDFTSIPVFHKILNSPSTQEQVYKLDKN